MTGNCGRENYSFKNNVAPLVVPKRNAHPDTHNAVPNRRYTDSAVHHQLTTQHMSSVMLKHPLLCADRPNSCLVCFAHTGQRAPVPHSGEPQIATS